MTRIIGPPKSRRRHWTSLWCLIVALGVGVFYISGASAAKRSSDQASNALVTCTATPAIQLVTGSRFEIDTDANLVVNGGADCLDWKPLGTAGIVKADQPTGSNDDAFKQGADINDAQPAVDFGSIPPNKSDLSNFGVYIEHEGAQTILNLFWSRVQNPSGTTDMDFELNRLQCGPAPTYTNCADNTPSGGKTQIHLTPLRSQGDVMITYLLASGGTNPTIQVRIWNGNSTAGSWGAATTITGAKSSINTSTITAANSYIGSLSPFTFGEASIDSAALFGSGSGCRSFGSAYLRSRASDTDTTAGKDFIAPEPISLTNCGSVVVKKTDNATPPNLQSGATFTITPGAQAADGTIAASSTLTDEASTTAHHGTATHAGYYCVDNVPLDTGATTHTVQETAAPPGFDLDPNPTRTVKVTNTSTCDDRMNATGGPTPDVDTATPPAPLLFVDPAQRGAIVITKVAKDANCSNATPPANCSDGKRPLAGAIFKLKNSSGTVVGTFAATGTDGKACLDNLAFGSYTVTEDSAPTGYSKAGDQTASVSAKGTCTTGTQASPANSFVDVPLSSVRVVFTSSAGTGVTKASIVCTKGTSNPTTVAADTENGSADPALDDSDETFSSLAPDTYNCTVVVDP
jgi:hypothetical protein